MMVDISPYIQAFLTVIGFGAAVVWQSATLKRGLETLTDRMEKIENEVSKMTDILIKQEGHATRLDSLTQRIDRHERWHDEVLAKRERRTKSRAAS